MKTIYEKVDKAATLIETMYLSHVIKNEKDFKNAHHKAGKLLFDVLRLLESKEFES